MGFLKKLFFRPAPVTDPMALRAQLFAAANGGDDATLHALCATNRAMIAEHFADWAHTKSYAHIDQSDPNALKPVITGLQAVALCFRDKLGDPSLHQRLVPQGDKNPFHAFNQAADEVNAHFAQHHYEQGVEKMTAAMRGLDNVAGPNADDYRGIGYAFLGNACLQAGRAAEAVEPFRRAVMYFQALKNGKDYAANLQGLYETHRYLGQPVEAAECAEHLANAWAEFPAGARWRKRAAIVRAGEPPLRMVVSLDGHSMMEIDEAPPGAEVKTFYERNRPTLLKSAALVQQGDGLLCAGKFADAVPIYHAAAAADPFNPHPHYQLGMTHLLLQQYVEALSAYEATARLGPGWYNLNSEIWIARQLAAAKIEHHVYVTGWAVEGGVMDAATRLATLETVRTSAATYPHLFLMEGQAYLELGKKDEARTAFERGITHVPEPDLCSRLLSQLALLSDEEERRRHHEGILALQGANMQAVTLARVALGSNLTS